MRNIVHAVAVAASTLLMAMPTVTARADDIQIQLGGNGPDGIYRKERRHDWGDNDFGQCSPDRALWKAQRMGIRRARIDHVGRRSIAVRGWQDGDRIIVRFDRRDRRCGILD